MKTLVVCSGGMDSVTLAYKVAKEHTLSGLLTFNYGQRHKKEMDYAQICADTLGVPLTAMDISNIGRMLSGSALTDDIDVPEGHYSDENMRVTVVPNRNAIMLTIAYGIASSQNLDAVATAVHGGDHATYPDCRPDFISSFEVMQKHALGELGEIKLYTPFLYSSKAEIAKEAVKLSVPFENTWSCYKGQDLHCGRCGTCVARQEAIAMTGAGDPTQYQDPDFWKSPHLEESVA